MRHVICSGCSRPAGHGTTQVLRKLIFHFCGWCWYSKRQKCNDVMQKAAA